MVKFLFDSVKSASTSFAVRCEKVEALGGSAGLVCGGSVKDFRTELAERDDFDESLLTSQDIRENDSTPMLIQFLKSSDVDHKVKAAIIRLENDRSHPRKAVLAAYKSTIKNSTNIGL